MADLNLENPDYGLCAQFVSLSIVLHTPIDLPGQYIRDRWKGWEILSDQYRMVTLLHRQKRTYGLNYIKFQPLTAPINGPVKGQFGITIGFQSRESGAQRTCHGKTV